MTIPNTEETLLAWATAYAEKMNSPKPVELVVDTNKRGNRALIYVRYEGSPKWETPIVLDPSTK